jgi:hypothetical protein
LAGARSARSAARSTLDGAVAHLNGQLVDGLDQVRTLFLLNRLCGDRSSSGTAGGAEIHAWTACHGLQMAERRARSRW